MGTIRVETVGVNDAMSPAHFVIGFGPIPTILETAVAIVLLWLMIRIGNLADAYSAKPKAKLS